MAATEFKGMVVLDGVRWRKDDLERIHPDLVKDAVPVDDDLLPADAPRVDTVPGGVVTGKDKLGAPVVDTTDSAAGNGVIVDVPGGTVGSGDEGKEAGKRPERGTRAKK